MKRGAKSWWPIAYAAAMAVYPVVNAKLRGPKTRQRYLTPAMDIADAVANQLAADFGKAPDVLKARVAINGKIARVKRVVNARKVLLDLAGAIPNQPFCGDLKRAADDRKVTEALADILRVRDQGAHVRSPLHMSKL